jgi:hypothetical protein
MKRIVLFLTIISFCLTIAWADQPAKTGDKDTIDITVPRMAIALALDDEREDKAGAIRLLASEFTQNEIPLVPTDVNVGSLRKRFSMPRCLRRGWLNHLECGFDARAQDSPS